MDVKIQLSFWEIMVNTWFVMGVLVLVSWLVTRRLRVDAPLSPWQHALEMVVENIHGQIREVAADDDATPYTPFVGTLFLFVAAGALLGILPEIGSSWWGDIAFYHAPTASLETTVALALCAFLAVPVFAIRRRGMGHWLKTYLQPTPFMLPFNIIGDVSRSLALAVRLFGNMMSGVVIGAILLSVAPLFFPVLMQLFGLLTGIIQAYIFAMLAMVYIASAVQVEQRRVVPPNTSPPDVKAPGHSG